MGTYEVTVTAEVPIEDTEWTTNVFEFEAEDADEAKELAIEKMEDQNWDAIAVFVEEVNELDTEDE